MALDKTGTLTKGKPELTDIATAGSLEERDVLRLVASVESRSEHPVAEVDRRWSSFARPRSRGSADFESEPGFGVMATVDGKRVQVGADRLMRRIGLDLSPFEANAAALADQGKTPLYAAIDVNWRRCWRSPIRSRRRRRCDRQVAPTGSQGRHGHGGQPPHGRSHRLGVSASMRSWRKCCNRQGRSCEIAAGNRGPAWPSSGTV